MTDPVENENVEERSDENERASQQVTEPNPPLPQLYGQDMQGHDAAAAESGEDVARADREPDEEEEPGAR
ncbi:hypothetical protein [Schumannella soli]|uniref:Uncharacterized protein n=1 Tax=Schumannella soli TaxID=2590779 RepID=A0A506XXJ3_9MICO|nr:hypothetical protein [Schumannella soli]TPW77481.1 hypothetical protein FJ657_02020 [Schumannella soli]